MSVELTIPVDPKMLIHIDIKNGALVFTTTNKEQYKDFRKTLEEVIKSIDNVLKNYW